MSGFLIVVLFRISRPGLKLLSLSMVIWRTKNFQGSILTMKQWESFVERIAVVRKMAEGRPMHPKSNQDGVYKLL